MDQELLPVNQPSAHHVDEKPLGYDELFLPFTDAYKRKELFRVGLESERFGIHCDTGKPLSYKGPRGILELFERFVTRNGWSAQSESPGGPTISLQRGDATITLEPGGQVELSGSPMADIHAMDAELQRYMGELRTAGVEMGIQWMGLGFQPVARQEDLGWVPKARYKVMRVYLATRGSSALDMMRRTATVQANFDFSDEADAMRKLRLSLRLSPIISSMFANGPFVEGKPFGGRSRRLQVWLDVDPDRQGLLPRMWQRTASLRDYVEWALDVPMFLIKRGSTVLENTGQPFRAFMREGFHGQRARMADWQTHLNTLFPEVRLKRTLEVRGADSVPADLTSALPAIWTGILYDDVAMDAAERASQDWHYEQVEAVRNETAIHGLHAPFQGKTVADTAETIFRIAEDGLRRRARVDSCGRDETVHLSGLGNLLEHGMTPADKLLENFRGNGSEGDFRNDILQRIRA